MIEKQRIATLIKHLPFKHRIILALVYVEDLSLKEIADCCGLSPSDTYSRYLEAMNNLYAF